MGARTGVAVLPFWLLQSGIDLVGFVSCQHLHVFLHAVRALKGAIARGKVIDTLVDGDHVFKALTCNIVRTLLGESHSQPSVRCAWWSSTVGRHRESD